MVTVKNADRREIRLALASKGRMEAEPPVFLGGCGLHVVKLNPRPYIALMPAIPELQVWFHHRKYPG
jgi:ATP phosphoribosyltransferase